MCLRGGLDEESTNLFYMGSTQSGRDEGACFRQDRSHRENQAGWLRAPCLNLLLGKPTAEDAETDVVSRRASYHFEGSPGGPGEGGL